MRTKNAIMNRRSITFDPFNSHGHGHESLWGNEFPWVQHTVMTDTNGAPDKKRMYCEVCKFFSGHWIWDSGHQNFEASVPKGHQNMNVFVGPFKDTSVFVEIHIHCFITYIVLQIEIVNIDMYSNYTTQKNK